MLFSGCGYIGDFASGTTVRGMWNSNDGNGAAMTRSTNGTISVYKDGGTSQSTAGITDIEDFDGLTGTHLVIIDTSADVDFYTDLSDFAVMLSGATIDTRVVNGPLFSFSLRNRTLELFGGAVNAILGGVGIIFAQTTELQADWTDGGRLDEILDGRASQTSVDTIDEFIDTEIAAIKAKTDNLPASPANEATLTTIASYLDTEIAAILAAVDTEVAAIKAKTDLIPGTTDGKTPSELAKLIAAVLLGKASGLDGTAPAFRAIDDSKNRVTATVDELGNRIAVVLDAS